MVKFASSFFFFQDKIKFLFFHRDDLLNLLIEDRRRFKSKKNQICTSTFEQKNQTKTKFFFVLLVQDHLFSYFSFIDLSNVLKRRKTRVVSWPSSKSLVSSKTFFQSLFLSLCVRSIKSVGISNRLPTCRLKMIIKNLNKH